MMTLSRTLSFLAATGLSLLTICSSFAADPQTTASTPASLPTLYLIGDSTVKNSTKGFMGWGTPIEKMFDSTKIRVANRALGGRSSRSFLREGLWDKVVADLRPGDFVMMQFGHNDSGPFDEGKARASIKGNSDETREVVIKETGAKEVVQSYGWYLRKYISDAKAKGATVYVCSLIPRNIWAEGRIKRASEGHGKWAKEASEQAGATFVDLNAIVADRYEREGEEKVKTTYFTTVDHTHTTPAGAEANAQAVIEGLRNLKDTPLAAFAMPASPTEN